MLASLDGRVLIREHRVGTDPDQLGRAVARFLLDERGGRDLLADLRERGTMTAMTPPPEPVVAARSAGSASWSPDLATKRHRWSMRWRRRVPKRYRFRSSRSPSRSMAVSGFARRCGSCATATGLRSPRPTVPQRWPTRSVSAHSPMAFGSQWSVPEPAIGPSRSVCPSTSCLPMRSPRVLPALPAPPITGGRVVLARAEVAQTLPIHLRMMGWNVDEVVAYRTVSADIDESAVSPALRQTPSSSPPVRRSIRSSTPSGSTDSRRSSPDRSGDLCRRCRAGRRCRRRSRSTHDPRPVDALVTHVADRPVLHREPRRERRRTVVSRAVLHRTQHPFRSRPRSTRCSPPTSTRSRHRTDSSSSSVSTVTRWGAARFKRSDPAVIDIKRMWLRSDVPHRPRPRCSAISWTRPGRWVSTGFGSIPTRRSSRRSRLYESSGFVAVERFNDDPHATHFFERALD